MTAKEFFSSLIGLTIEEACKRLGCWWVLDSSRSAFHASAGRESKNGKYTVYFDLSKWR